MLSNFFVLNVSLALLALSQYRAINMAEAGRIADSVPGANSIGSWFRDSGNKMKNTFSRMKDSDRFKDVTGMIRARGFEVEEHWVVTKDEYILLVQRIINPLVTQDRRHELRPVILQHGLLSNQVDFVVQSRNVRPVDPFMMREKYKNDSFPELVGLDVENLPEDTQEHPNALAYYLANRGYDVFLGSSRGSTYGMKHVRMSNWKRKFWEFSFDELIKYDLTAIIKYVRRETGYQKVGYVGHSQGSIIMFGLLADQPHYAEIVEPFIALAPVAYIANAISPTRHIFRHMPNFNFWFITGPSLLRHLLHMVCTPQFIRTKICAQIIFMVVGENKEEMDYETLPARMSQLPAGTSVKNIAHYGQEGKSGRFCKFDYGPRKNLIKYGQESSPDYDIRKITSKSVVLFTANNDWLSQPADIDKLISEFQVPLYALYNMTLALPKYNHVDFVYGRHVGQLINRRAAKVLDDFAPKNYLTRLPSKRYS